MDQRPEGDAVWRLTGHGTSHRSQSRRTVDHLQLKRLAGEPNTSCLDFARREWGLPWDQGYKLVERAWMQIKDDVDETGIDRQEMLAWSIQALMTAAG